MKLSQAEVAGLTKMAKGMSLKDLEWQTKNGGKTGVTGAALKIFKDEQVGDTITVKATGETGTVTWDCSVAFSSSLRGSRRELCAPRGQPAKPAEPGLPQLRTQEQVDAGRRCGRLPV